MAARQKGGLALAGLNGTGASPRWAWPERPTAGFDADTCFPRASTGLELELAAAQGNVDVDTT